MTPPSDDDRPTGRGGLDIVMGALFLVMGIVFLVMPHSSGRQGMFLLLGLVNIVVGLIKIVRGAGSLGSIQDRRDPE